MKCPICNALIINDRCSIYHYEMMVKHHYSSMFSAEEFWLFKHDKTSDYEPNAWKYMIRKSSKELSLNIYYPSGLFNKDISLPLDYDITKFFHSESNIKKLLILT